MRYAMLLGCVWLGVSVVGCGGVNRAAPLLDQKPIGMSSGRGGAEVIDTGQWAPGVRTPKSAQQQRELYEAVAQELGLEGALVTPGGYHAESGMAVGGGGKAGSERRSCAEVLAANEPAAVVTGRLDFALNGVLTVNVPGKGPMKLVSDESTCAIQGRRLLGTNSLLVGTEAQVAYVLENGLPTARVVRAAPVRMMR